MPREEALRVRRVVEARRRALEERLERLARLLQEMSEEEIREAVELANELAGDPEAAEELRRAVLRELGRKG